jgi:hypothetical protein
MENPMISIRYKVMAYAHATMGAACLFAALNDLFLERITPFTPLNLLMAAVNFWLGINRMEGK